MSTQQLIAGIIGLALIVFGLAGTIVPRLPGPYLVFIGVFFSGLLTGFSVVTPSFIALSGGAMLVAYLLDARGSRGGNRAYRITALTVLVAVIGGLVGSALGGFFTILTAAMIGAVIGGLIAGHDTFFSIESAQYTFIGYLGGSLLKLTIGILILFAWLRRFFV